MKAQDEFSINSESRSKSMSFMTPEGIEKRMDELGSTLAETHDKKIIKELYELALERENVDKKSRE
jgi:hypothetical protein